MHLPHRVVVNIFWIKMTLPILIGNEWILWLNIHWSCCCKHISWNAFWINCSPKGSHYQITLQALTKIPLLEKSCNAELSTSDWCLKNRKLDSSAVPGKNWSCWIAKTGMTAIERKQGESRKKTEKSNPWFLLSPCSFHLAHPHVEPA